MLKNPSNAETVQLSKDQGNGAEPLSFENRFKLDGKTKSLVLAARALAPRLRERAPDAERRRVVHDETIRDLAGAGLFRLMQPTSYEGYGRQFADYILIAEELGAGCPSTA